MYADVCDELLAVWFNISFMFLAANIETGTINVCRRMYVMTLGCVVSHLIYVPSSYHRDRYN